MYIGRKYKVQLSLSDKYHFLSTFRNLTGCVLRLLITFLKKIVNTCQRKETHPQVSFSFIKSYFTGCILKLGII